MTTPYLCFLYLSYILCINCINNILLELEPRALYIHCYGHALNMAVQDSLKGSKIMADTLDIVHEITKIIKLFLTNSKMFLQDHLEFAFFARNGGR